MEAIRRSGLFVSVADAEGLGYHLDQLVEWGNLTRSHDTAAVSRRRRGGPDQDRSEMLRS
jgi:hypothetical protein